jgi:hypothetical protein
MAASKRLVKSLSPRKPRVLCQSTIADLLFARDIADRLMADVRRRETEIIDALKSGAEVEAGEHSVSIKKNRLELEKS